MKVLSILVALFALAHCASAQSLIPYYYDIGSPSLTDLYVDPVAGSDSRSGTSRATALRSVRAAWSKIPTSTTLSTGYRLNLLPGTYGDDADELPNYWELKRGTFTAPVILQAADGQGTVRFVSDVNMANVSYVYLLNLEVTAGGDTFHCEGCDHILLRGNTFIGSASRNVNSPDAHETIKVNQSQFVFIENNVVRGAQDNAIDWVAVQYGHIVGNRLANTQGWCMYVKGGSAYVRIEANEVSDCFEGGITSGQGTGLEFMTGPWFQYEAYDVKIINNIIYDVAGAALGVNGGYNILLAHNTAYRVGSRSHLIEVVFGSRSCDGDARACAARIANGAWGTNRTGGDFEQPIGNRNVKILNNVIYNPSGFQSGSQHLTIQGPRTPTHSSVPSPQRTDDQLEIKGNIFWNGSSSMPLGVEDGDQGCASTNPTCNQTQLLRDNAINTLEPAFINVVGHDFRPAATGPLATYAPTSLTPFTARGASEATPEGDLSNTFLRDRSGTEYSSLLVGAYSSSSATLTPPTNGGVGTPSDPTGGGGNGSTPTISGLTAKLKKQGRTFVLTVRFVAQDDSRIASATATVRGHGRIKLTAKGSTYSGSKNFAKKTRGVVSIAVVDADGNRSEGTISF